MNRLLFLKHNFWKQEKIRMTFCFFDSMYPFFYFSLFISLEKKQSWRNDNKIWNMVKGMKKSWCSKSNWLWESVREWASEKKDLKFFDAFIKFKIFKKINFIQKSFVNKWSNKNKDGGWRRKNWDSVVLKHLCNKFNPGKLARKTSRCQGESFG